MEIPIEDIMPDPNQVLSQQGVPVGSHSENILGVATEACRILSLLLSPRGILTPIEIETFVSIYLGQGDNDESSPLDQIFPKADRLALFAVTAGPAVGAKISQLFAAHEYPLAAALDAAASLAADQSAQWLQDHWSSSCTPDSGVLRYSPGYCGWHVSGQIKLFATLEPAGIGISLGESCLMDPLKSVSGVLVSGSPQIHDFEPDFGFCNDCAHHQCRDRIEHGMSHGKKEI